MDKLTHLATTQILETTLQPLHDLIHDIDTQEIMINGPNDVWVEQKGSIRSVPINLSEVAIRSAITVLASLENKEARENSIDSIVYTRLRNLRISAVLAPTAISGHAIAIRKHTVKATTLAEYMQTTHVPASLALRLQNIMTLRKNILVVGGTSSGKTTLLNALLSAIDPTDRVITIEDTQELKVNTPNRVQLVSNETNSISMRDLVKLSLRLRPDRIIVGEVRGSEAFDLLQAANTGHDGCLATLHANNALAGLYKLEAYVMTANLAWPLTAIRQQIAETFHYVIFMARTPSGQRGIQRMIEITGFDIKNNHYIIENIFSTPTP